MERHAQYINRGELAGRGGSLLRHRSAGGEQLHCASLVSYFFFLLLLFLYSFSLQLLLFLVSSVFLFLL